MFQLFSLLFKTNCWQLTAKMLFSVMFWNIIKYFKKQSAIFVLTLLQNMHNSTVHKSDCRVSTISHSFAVFLGSNNCCTPYLYRTNFATWQFPDIETFF